MSLWKQRFHFISGSEIESFNTQIDETKYQDSGGWLKAYGDDENSFILINCANVECVEFEKVE